MLSLDIHVGVAPLSALSRKSRYLQEKDSSGFTRENVSRACNLKAALAPPVAPTATKRGICIRMAGDLRKPG